jgi:hypothetical protein
LNATDRQRELLKEVLELKQQLAALSEQLVEVQRKRGSVG